MKRTTIIFVALLLAACGGGSDTKDAANDISDGIDPTLDYYSWSGNRNEKTVLDGDDQRFRVTVADGCLFSEEKNAKIINWCRAGGTGTDNPRMLFVDRWIVPMLHPAASGNGCVAVLVDEATGLIIDVFRNPDNQQFQYQSSGRHVQSC